jgi:serine/threonine-protein kinase
MKLRRNSCDAERLRRLAEDRLAPGEISELEEHVQNCADCRGVLDALVGGERWVGVVRRHLRSEPTESRQGGRRPWESLDFLAPSDWPDSLGRLGTYEVKGILGHGGMGIVLKAFDPALSRNVAIKVLAPSLASCGAARRRFLREARAAAAVVHEHVVSVFAVVETAGLPFLVMEYVPGRSLQERLDADGPLSLPEILRVGMQAAAGLAAAHAHGLVHRDIKPANILLENGVERVRLTDFGLARAVADASFTQSGVISGTPHYMAPEQARAETTDGRADLFSLGSTLYAMCCGHPPFRAANPVAVVRRVTDDEPRPIRELNPEIPAWLEGIIAKLHAKQPDLRFQSATEVADLLSRCLAHVQQPLVAPLPRDIPLAHARFKGVARRRRLGLAIAGLAIITVGTLISRPWRLWQPIGSNTKNAAAALPSPHPLGYARQPRGSADEIADQIRNTRGRVEEFAADMHRRDDLPDSNSVFAMAARVSAQVRSLERELASGRDPPNGSSKDSTSLNRSERR